MGNQEERREVWGSTLGSEEAKEGGGYGCQCDTVGNLDVDDEAKLDLEVSKTRRKLQPQPQPQLVLTHSFTWSPCRFPVPTNDCRAEGEVKSDGQYERGFAGQGVSVVTKRRTRAL